MRRLSSFFDRDESGGTITFVAIALAALLGFSALAIDMGRVYAERRQLQTGADAGAHAIALECVAGGCTGAFDPYTLADEYADDNANDSTANVSDVVLNVAGGRVDVETQTEDVDGPGGYDLLLAGIVGFDSFDVRAKAAVAWGVFGGGATLPLAFSECEWEQFGEPGFVDEGGFLHYKASVDAGLLPPTSGYPYASDYVRIYFHGDQEVDDSLDCHESPSGQDLAGGFGWLDTTGSFCAADVAIGEWIVIDPGSSPSNGCTPIDVADLLGNVALIPYFDDQRDVGGNAEYHISGIGALYITGYNFGGQYKRNSVITGSAVCGGNDRCVEGYMIGDWVVTGGDIGGPGHGVTVVKFVE